MEAGTSRYGGKMAAGRGRAEEGASQELGLRHLTDDAQAVQAAQSDLARAKERSRGLESDLAKMQAALGDTRKLGDTNVGLELERDRLKRDLARAQDDVARLREDVARKEDELRERNLAASTAVRCDLVSGSMQRADTA